PHLKNLRPQWEEILRDLFLNRAKEGCRLSRTIGEERPEIYRIEAGSDLPLYPTVERFYVGL
ncbi:MAG: hypothetical protein IJP35_03685, partial [Clostridia bacterium]|nr:hypothetical protein [Clostridia bacterium]